MRTAFGIFIFLHGIAHTPGFAVPWRFLHSPDLPYRTTIAFGTLDLGDKGIRAYAVLWLLLVIAFCVVAAQYLLRMPAFNTTFFVVAISSTVLCALSLPEARIGLAVNIGLIAAVLAAGQRA